MTDVQVMCGFCGQTLATWREPWDREAGDDGSSHAIFVCSTCGRVYRVQSRELQQRVETAFGGDADVVLGEVDRTGA